MKRNTLVIRSLEIALVLALVLAPAAAGQTSDDCLTCHSDHDLTMQKGAHTVALFVGSGKLQSSVHAGLACVDCHAGFSVDSLPHAKNIQPVDCRTCHDVAGYEPSIHALPRARATADGRGVVAAACKDCHGTHDVLTPADPASAVNRSHIAATCGKCHAAEAEHFTKSAHGVALAAGVRGAPTCIECHGTHEVALVTSKDSPVYKLHEAQVCLKCHQDNPDVRSRVGPTAGFIAAYATSVHGVALAQGNPKAATCSDCHGAHDMQKGSDPRALEYKLNIPATCGRCHEDAARTYGESIHGVALHGGNLDAPSCTDCHGEHQILAHTDPQSRVAARNVSAQVCGSCHGSVQLSQKYGLATERLKTFEDSYHGLASRGGSLEVANCASCHGYHDIRPSTDVSSKISPSNLAQTCGQCHPGASANFAKGNVHVTFAKTDSAALYWVRILYLGLIVTVVGGMVLHNIFDFGRKFRVHHDVRHGRIQAELFGPTHYVRMTLNERLQHGALLLSFFTLVLTGFMLKWPDAWWVVQLRRFIPQVFEMRSIAHRVSGVVLLGTSLTHLVYVIVSQRGRQLIRDLAPRIHDAKGAAAQTLYNVGLKKQRPYFGRFSYIEKLEYWALIWGVIVMGATGIILWFDNYFLNVLTKLGWDIARAIHYYEAILATLAIMVWHWYFVTFSPSAYPMNASWWTGVLTEEEMAEDHPLELAEIRARAAPEQAAPPTSAQIVDQEEAG